MAKKGGANHRHTFKPGNKHGKGNIAHPQAVKDAAKITVVTVRARIKEFMNTGKTTLQETVEKNDIPIIDCIIAKALLLAADGNIPSLNLILDRAIGKVKEEFEIKMPRPMIVDNLETNTQMLLSAEEIIEGEVIEKNHD
jgi:hypothetical protein